MNRWFLVQSRVFGWISLIIPESKRFLFLIYFPEDDFIISKANYALNAFSKVYEIFFFFFLKKVCFIVVSDTFDLDRSKRTRILLTKG